MHRLCAAVVMGSKSNVKQRVNNIAIAGEYAVLSQLALHGFDANVTLGATKHVDILASDPLTLSMSRIEVKTSQDSGPHMEPLFGRSYQWIMSQKHEHIIDPRLFYCFVAVNPSKFTFEFFIVPNSVVAQYVAQQHQVWLGRPNRRGVAAVNTANTMRKFRLGIDGQAYPLNTPMADFYRDKWNILST
jgi:hypothetical protein